ncbi:MAG: hypothetical protein J3R72DRAFT_493685 [Linnemannia gamsii]|nr:MAG: hypothetical protein J3R72DRAFT_493685 [Linnemannia gamsii]
MTIIAPSVSCTKEITLRVVSPLFGDNGNQKITSPSCPYKSSWEVNLSRSGKTLAVVVTHNPGSNLKDYTFYCSMLIFRHGEYDTTYCTPLSSIMFVNGGTHTGTIEAEKVIKDNKYDFEIVFCTGTDVSRKLKLPPPSPKNMDIIPLLLKDANSVDACFTFTSDKVHSNVGLWAHRVVLMRHKVFAKLFQEQDELQSLVRPANEKDDKTTKVESDAESTCTVTAEGTPTPSPTTFTATTKSETLSLITKVDKFSLATFCALLYYIYTDEVHLTIDTERFAISSGEGSLVWRDTLTGKIRDSIRWHPIDPTSPYKLKDVTWDELLEAADHYGISDLRSNCLTKVISGMNQSNAVGTLFSKAVKGTEVRVAAMEFIVKHWGDFFGEGKSDPFVGYRENLECHEVLIELMQLKAKS